MRAWLARGRRGTAPIILGVIVVVVAVVVTLGGLFALGTFSPEHSTNCCVTTIVPNYPLVFTETGLPSETTWSVALNGASQSSTGSSITVAEPNGTYSFTVGSVSGYTERPSSGSVAVNGAAVSETISFTPTTTPKYTVTFTEIGLTSGTSWSVTVGRATESSATPSIVFGLVNGSYAYTVGGLGVWYPVSGESGSFTVNGAAANETITFTALPPHTYAATFVESGLPNGTVWSVFFNGTLTGGNGGPFFSGAIASTNATSLSFPLVNGTYPFYVGGMGCGFAWSATNVSSGSPLAIDGASVTIRTTFSPRLLPIPPPQCVQQSPPYLVTFTESGLPSGVLWNVSFDDTNVSANAGSFSYSVGNGTYPFNVTTMNSALYPSPSSGSVVVDGSSVTQPVTFSPSTTTTKASANGISDAANATPSATARLSFTIYFTPSGGSFSMFAVRMSHTAVVIFV